MNLFDLNGRVAVITGGNAGIGFGIAKRLAAAGSAIVIAGRQVPRTRGGAPKNN
jgi:2-deoxy-D-gluconate 3-dehydrogenase